MKIKNAKFLTSVSGKGKIPSFNLPEIAIVGRSNVGKSSFINMISNINSLAKTSSTPGRTRLVNYFLVNDEFVLVDLPGYGYAKAAKSEQGFWEEMITTYFADSNNLAGIIMLVDVRHTPSEKDIQMLNYLSCYNIPTVIVATKLDKVKKSQMESRKVDISSTLKVGKENVILISNETRQGKEKVLEKIEQLLIAFKGEVK